MKDAPLYSVKSVEPKPITQDEAREFCAALADEGKSFSEIAVALKELGYITPYAKAEPTDKTVSNLLLYRKNTSGGTHPLSALSQDDAIDLARDLFTAGSTHAAIAEALTARGYKTLVNGEDPTEKVVNYLITRAKGGRSRDDDVAPAKASIMTKEQATTLAVERLRAGYGMPTIAAELARRGYRTSVGKPPVKHNVRDLLRASPYRHLVDKSRRKARNVTPPVGSTITPAEAAKLASELRAAGRNYSYIEAELARRGYRGFAGQPARKDTIYYLIKHAKKLMGVEVPAPVPTVTAAVPPPPPQPKPKAAKDDVQQRLDLARNILAMDLSAAKQKALLHTLLGD